MSPEFFVLLNELLISNLSIFVSRKKLPSTELLSLLTICKNELLLNFFLLLYYFAYPESESYCSAKFFSILKKTFFNSTITPSLSNLSRHSSRTQLLHPKLFFFYKNLLLKCKNEIILRKRWRKDIISQTSCRLHTTALKYCGFGE